MSSQRAFERRGRWSRSVEVRLIAGVLALAGSALAPRLSADPLDEVTVARVGDEGISAGELNRRLARTPPFMLKRYGATADEIRKNYLDQVLVRERLLARGAHERGLDRRPDLADRIRRELRAALLASMRESTPPVTEQEIEAYYRDNQGRFESPARLSLWRILVDSEDEAKELLDELKRDLSAEKWSQLAREKSVDKATSMRGGSLGFVAPDGSSSQTGVHVDPAIFEAAAEVKDLELVPAPVREAGRFAVVWRRQSLKSVTRTLESEAPAIRQLLAHAKFQESVEALLVRLREEHVSGVAEELVDQLQVTSTGDIERAMRPGVLPKSRSRKAQPTPERGPGGLR